VGIDLTLMGHLSTGQTWLTPVFDGTGTIVYQERTVPARMLMSARVAGRPTEGLELSLTLWNPLGFADATAFREHPDGQPLGPRLIGAVRFSL
jgi:hypothetical protein